MRTILRILKKNFRYRKQIIELAKADQKKTYRGSDLGIVWAFVRPATYICVFYVAISLGFKSAKDIDGISCNFFIWLSIGMMAWFYMQAMLLGGAGGYRKYRLLITRSCCPLEIVPTIISVSQMMIHLALISITLILVGIFGTPPSIYWLEIPFYTFFMFIFAIAWSTATGLVSALSKDFYNLLAALSQAVFWLSAILFDVNGIESHAARTILLFNPVTYIVEGYRNAVCRHVWFWEQPKEFLCYLTSFAVVSLLAIILFKRTSKVVSDYL